MNGFSREVSKWSNERLLDEYSRLSETACYASPASDTHYLYRAVLRELKDRHIDPSKTITTEYGIRIPCDSDGRPHRDEPQRFIRSLR